MKRAPFLMYFCVNLCITGCCGVEIFRLIVGTFNYDGMRYFVPFALADLGLLIALCFLYFQLGFSRQFFVLLFLALLHNLAFCFRVDITPLLSFCVGAVSIFFVLKCISKA